MELSADFEDFKKKVLKFGEKVTKYKVKIKELLNRKE